MKRIDNGLCRSQSQWTASFLTFTSRITISNALFFFDRKIGTCVSSWPFKFRADLRTMGVTHNCLAKKWRENAAIISFVDVEFSRWNMRRFRNYDTIQCNHNQQWRCYGNNDNLFKSSRNNQCAFSTDRCFEFIDSSFGRNEKQFGRKTWVHNAYSSDGYHQMFFVFKWFLNSRHQLFSLSMTQVCQLFFINWKKSVE